MESPAEVAARCGIPAAKLEDLLELPEVAELLVVARESPNVPPEAIFANLNLPTCDPDGLDIDKLEATLARLRALGARSDGFQHQPEAVRGSGVMVGQLERVKKELKKKEEVLLHVAQLLGPDDGTFPASTNIGAARKVLKEWSPW